MSIKEDRTDVSMKEGRTHVSIKEGKTHVSIKEDRTEGKEVEGTMSLLLLLRQSEMLFSEIFTFLAVTLCIHFSSGSRGQTFCLYLIDFFFF